MLSSIAITVVLYVYYGLYFAGIATVVFTAAYFGYFCGVSACRYQLIENSPQRGIFRKEIKNVEFDLRTQDDGSVI